MKNEASIKLEYSKLAKNYDTRWENYLKSTHDAVFKITNFKKGDSILDASGGTGFLSNRIIEKNPSVKIVIMDLSLDMLNIAKRRFDKDNRLSFSEGDVHKLPYVSERFSKVLSVSAFHFYSNPKKAVSEFHRVLKKNGELILIDWCRDNLHIKIFDAYMGIASKSHNRIFASKELKELVSKKFKIEKVLLWKYKLWSFVGIHAIKNYDNLKGGK